MSAQSLRKVKIQEEGDRDRDRRLNERASEGCSVQFAGHKGFELSEEIDGKWENTGLAFEQAAISMESEGA